MTITPASFKSSRFLPMGTPKTLVYAAPVDNQEALYHCIVVANFFASGPTPRCFFFFFVDACQTIRLRL
jgi:hypothetical protein